MTRALAHDGAGGVNRLAGVAGGGVIRRALTATVVTVVGVCSVASPTLAQSRDGAGEPDVAGARSIAGRVAALADGTVHLSFAARDGVCGNGRNVSVTRPGGEWESDCEPGPVRVSLTRQGGETTGIRSYVGGRWRQPTDGAVSDLGTVPSAAAAAYLLQLAEELPAAPAAPAADAIFPATLADSVTVWPRLLRLARDARRPVRVREQAVFWVGQAAGVAATRELSALVDEADTELAVRERAVFALSQRPADEGVPALLRIARTSPSPQLRRRAIFWLGQAHDPRALAYFEEVLAGRP